MKKLINLGNKYLYGQNLLPYASRLYSNTQKGSKGPLFNAAAEKKRLKEEGVEKQKEAQLKIKVVKDDEPKTRKNKKDEPKIVISFLDDDEYIDTSDIYEIDAGNVNNIKKGFSLANIDNLDKELEEIENNTQIFFSKLNISKESFKDKVVQEEDVINYVPNLYDDYEEAHTKGVEEFYNERPGEKSERDDKSISWRMKNMTKRQAWKDVERMNSAIDESLKQYEKYLEGEEGIDYVKIDNHPMLITEKKIARMVNAEERRLRAVSFGLSKEDELQKKIQMKKLEPYLKAEIRVDEIKFYPGSPKGPNPEDDPRAYTKWFIENQPPSLYPEGYDYDDKSLGIHTTNINGQSETEYIPNDLVYSAIDSFENANEAYPYQKYKNSFPQWEIFKHLEKRCDERNNEDEEQGMLSVSVQTELPQSLLMPLLPPEIPLDYHEAVFKIEKWSVYRVLPDFIYQLRGLNEVRNAAKLGLSSLMNTYISAPPSIFTYYRTLPKWARDHPFIQNTVSAMEFTKPLATLREKELALNFACSLILPLSDKLKNLMLIGATSRKQRLNMADGKRILAELDQGYIDLDDDENEGGRDFNEESDDDTDKSITDHEDTDSNNTTPKSEELKAEYRRKRKENLELIKSMNIQGNERRKEIKNVSKEQEASENKLNKENDEEQLEDFYVKPYPDLDVEPEPRTVLPLEYYDNDDGFWDEYIKEKEERAFRDNPMIVGRPFFKH